MAASRLTNTQVMRIALPVTLASLSVPLVGLADTAVIGRLAVPALIGGVGAAGVIANFVLYTGNFLRFSTVGLVAQAEGRGQHAEGMAVLLRALLTAIAFGVVAILLQRPIIELGIGFIGVDTEVAGAVRDYLSIRLWSTPFALSHLALLAYLAARAEVMTALVLQLLLNLSNVALSILLVIGAGWAVQGAAAATVMAETLTVLLGVALVLARRRAILPAALVRLADTRGLAGLFSVSVDILIRSMALLFAIAAFTRAGAAFGTLTLAANVMLMTLFYLAGAFMDGIATTAQRVAGMAYGAGSRARFAQGYRLLLVWAVAVGAGVSLLYWGLREPIVGQLSADPAARAEALRYYGWIAVLPLAGSMTFLLDGVFSGLTWTRDMRNTMLVSLALYLVALQLLPVVFGNDGLWLAFVGFVALRGITLGARLRKAAPGAFGAAA